MHAGILPLGACVVLLAMISLDMVDLLRPSMLATLEMDILLLSDSSIVRLSARPSCVYSCIVPPFLLLVFFGEIDNSGKGGMLPQMGERLPNLTQPCALTLREQEWGVRLVREVSGLCDVCALRGENGAFCKAGVAGSAGVGLWWPAYQRENMALRRSSDGEARKGVADREKGQKNDYITHAQEGNLYHASRSAGHHVDPERGFA